MEIIFDYSELCSLLAEAGVGAPVGVEAAHFPPCIDADKQGVLQAGLTKSRGREEADRRALVQVLAEPMAVLHATHVQANKPDEHVWFFYTPARIVRLQRTNENQYQLTAVSETTAIMDQIHQFLPLQPTLPDLTYRVKIPYEDFLTLRELATEWNEVPALEILEADGLDQVTSRDLFDSAVGPEWRGIIDCLTCQGQMVTGQTTLRVLQGVEISWLIRPSTDDKLVVETAQPGLFQDALAKAWQTALTEYQG